MKPLKIFVSGHEFVIACHISKAVLIADLSLRLEQEVFQAGISSEVQSTVHSVRLRLKCDGTRAETIFRLSAKWMSPFKSAGESVQSTTGSRSVHVSGSNAGYTMFRGSVKSTGYPLHSPVSPSLPIPCFTVCHHISTWLYSISARLILLDIAAQVSASTPSSLATAFKECACVCTLALSNGQCCALRSCNVLLALWLCLSTGREFKLKKKKSIHS